MSILGPIYPERYAGLSACSRDVGVVICGIDIALYPDDAKIPGSEFARRYFDPAEPVLADAIERHGRHRFIGVSFAEQPSGSGSALTISAHVRA